MVMDGSLSANNNLSIQPILCISNERLPLKLTLIRKVRTDCGSIKIDVKQMKIYEKLVKCSLLSLSSCFLSFIFLIGNNGGRCLGPARPIVLSKISNSDLGSHISPLQSFALPAFVVFNPMHVMWTETHSGHPENSLQFKII